MQPPVNHDQSPAAVAARMRLVWEMYEVGVSMSICRLQRLHPSASEAEINRLLAEELHGDRDDHDPFLRPSPCPIFSPTS